MTTRTPLPQPGMYGEWKPWAEQLTVALQDFEASGAEEETTNSRVDPERANVGLGGRLLDPRKVQYLPGTGYSGLPPERHDWRGSGGKDISKNDSEGGGRYVVFYSASTDFFPDDYGPLPEEGMFHCIFRRDRKLKRTEIVSVDINRVLPPGNCWDPSISDDGRVITFQCQPAKDGTFWGVVQVAGVAQVWAKNMSSGNLMLVSGQGGAASNSNSRDSRVSGDGNWCGFISEATNLASGITGQNAWINSTNGLGSCILVSRGFDNGNQNAPTVWTTPGDSRAIGTKTIVLNYDGEYAFFDSTSTNIISGLNTNNTRQMYRFKRSTLTSVLASRAAGGSAFGEDIAANHHGNAQAGVSADGNTAVWATSAPEFLTPLQAANGATTIIWRNMLDFTAAGLRVVPRDWQGNIADGSHGDSGLSPNGRYVACESNTPAILKGGTHPGYMNSYIWDLQRPPAVEVVNKLADGTVPVNSEMHRWPLCYSVAGDKSYKAQDNGGGPFCSLPSPDHILYSIYFDGSPRVTNNGVVVSQGDTEEHGIWNIHVAEPFRGT